MKKHYSATQKAAVRKVLEEKKKAEEYVIKRWGACWSEQLTDGYCTSDLESCLFQLYRIERHSGGKYPDLTNNALDSTNTNGAPLVTETFDLVDDHFPYTPGKKVKLDCEFRRIIWASMNTHKAERCFSFYNDGTIEYSKYGRSSKGDSYKTSFNVLSEDFDINIDHYVPSKDEIGDYDVVKIGISLKGSTLIEKLDDDIEIATDLSSGAKTIKVEKIHKKKDRKNNASVVFKVRLNPDESLEIGTIAIDTYKSNGKINGSYRIRVNGEEIQAKYCTRKGTCIDLSESPELLKFANKLLGLFTNDKHCSSKVLQSFVDSTLSAIYDDPRSVSLGAIDFDMLSIKQAEKEVLELLKGIKGELPLQGLVERIDNCLKSYLTLRGQLLANQDRVQSFKPIKKNRT